MVAKVNANNMEIRRTLPDEPQNSASPYTLTTKMDKHLEART
jgi:hypothetical protein